VVKQNTGITPLIDFAANTQKELLANAKGYKNDPADPFDVAIKTDDLPEQARGKAATERLYRLRERLPVDKYRQLVAELKRGGLLAPDGSKIPDELSEEAAERANRLMDKYDLPQSRTPP
jgi:hypothetical protein